MKTAFSITYAAGIMLFSETLTELLLICDKKGVWRFPSGRLEAGETLLQAAVRKMFEDTNVSSDSYAVMRSPIPVASSPGTDRTAKVRFLFPAVLKAGLPPAVEPLLGVTSDVAWLEIEKAIDATRNPKRRAAILLGLGLAKTNALESHIPFGFEPDCEG